jgi:hypothetical protein
MSSEPEPDSVDAPQDGLQPIESDSHDVQGCEDEASCAVHGGHDQTVWGLLIWQSTSDEAFNIQHSIGTPGLDARDEKLSGLEVSMGRSNSNAVVVNDPRVSGIHCRIRQIGCEAFLENLSSSATFVNGNSIGQMSLHQLRGGELISLVMLVEPKPFDISFSFQSNLNNPSESRRARKATVDGEADTLSRTDTIAYKTPETVFEEEFNCGICYELMWKPLTLVPCAHSFCAACLSNWQRSQTPRPLSCPFCKDTVSLSMVFVNHSLRNLLNAYSGLHPSAAVSLSVIEDKDSATTLTDIRMPLILAAAQDEPKFAVTNAVQSIILSVEENDPESASVALLRLRHSISKDECERVRAFAVPAIQSINVLMRAHPDAEALQQSAVTALAYIAKNSRNSTYRSDLAGAIVRYDILSACNIAISTHASNDELCAEINSFLANVCLPMASESAERVPLIQYLRGYPDGVRIYCDLVYDGMKAHATKFRNQWNGSKALLLLLKGLSVEELTTVVVRLQALEPALKAFIDDKIVKFGPQAIDVRQQARRQRSTVVTPTRMAHLQNLIDCIVATQPNA